MAKVSTLNDGQMQVVVAAETLAKFARQNHPWWRRRKPSPFDFVPAAKAVVEAFATDPRLAWNQPLRSDLDIVKNEEMI